MKTIILSILVMAAIILTINCIAQDTGTVSVESELVDFKFFQHFSIGVAWEINDLEDHSIAFTSLVTFKDMLNLDIGLIDFEQVDGEGEKWFDDINPSIGLSFDVLQIMQKFEFAKNILLLAEISDVVGVGVGCYADIESDWDILPIVYLVAQW
jgi:hypothetical protein